MTPTDDWGEVDDYIVDQLLGDDDALDRALAANAAGGLPSIDVSAPQGKMLHLIARIAGARRICEVGTLGGYSTIWLARALPPGGTLVSLELDAHHADVARANVARAGLADRVDIRVGGAATSLAAMRDAGEGPFDLFFIDADKQSNVGYVAMALEMAHPGTVIIVDNVVRDGAVIEADNTDPAIDGTRKLYAAVAAEPRLSATVVQTVGSKGWDGFLLARVV